MASDTATNVLRRDHEQIKRLDAVVTRCSMLLYSGYDIPLSDIEKITFVIDEFLDSIHYSREEDSYFPCVASYDKLRTEIRKLMIEHEFSRRIAKNIARYLRQWKEGSINGREPVARFLRTYSIYLKDHMKKEEDFFDKAEVEVLSKDEEREMFDQFNSVLSITKKIDELISVIDYLERQPWYKVSEE